MGRCFYTDRDGNQIGYEDVFTRLDFCRRHFRDVGFGDGVVERMIR